MKKLLTLLLSGMLMGVLWSSVQAQDSGPFHPMDGLTPEEIQLGVSLLRNQQLVTDGTHFANIRLRELPKADVLRWKRGAPFGRQGIFIYRQGGKTYEAIADLSAQTVLSNREIPGAQPAVHQGEWNKAREAVLRSPVWQKEMAAIGYTEPKNTCDGSARNG